MPIDSSQKKMITRQLLACKAVEVNTETPFKLKNGTLSPIYINCRKAISHPVLMETFNSLAAAEMTDLFSDKSRQIIIAGGETAGIPFAAFLSVYTQQPMIYIRKTGKDYGTKDQIEGDVVFEGNEVLLVEDLITDGGSKKVFIDAIKNAGGQINHVLVLFDRQAGGREFLKDNFGIELHALTTLSTVLKEGEGAGYFLPAESDVVREYLNDPKAWNAKFAPEPVNNSD